MIEDSGSKATTIMLLSPNLGHPLILSVNPKGGQYDLDLLFASRLSDQNQFMETLRHTIFLMPILEYSWKLYSLLEKVKMEWLFTFFDRQRVSYWSKVKNFFLKKRRRLARQELLRKPLEFFDSIGNKFYFPEKGNFQNVRAKAFRGEQVEGIISHIEQVNIADIDSLNYDNYYSPRNYLVKQNIMGDLTFFYKVQIKFEVTNEIKAFLNTHKFIMFDIKLQFESSNNLINYHSLVLSKNDWNDLKIVQASDLHLAERNDRIYEIVKKWTSSMRVTNFNEFLSESAKTINFFQRIFSSKSKKNSKERSKLPLKKRYINPNNNFRTFIKLMNKQVLANELDFVVLTGDLIDFAIFSKLPKDMRKLVDFEYERSNWKVFKDILLNFPQEKKRGMVRGEELLCPVFTIPGNHDYRPFHYDIRWGGLYRKIGLNANEALALNDEFMANPISSITKTFQALKAYLKEINSSLDYFLKLGHINLVFLNSGSDSFKKLLDFVSGHPSLTGLTNKQINYLKSIATKKVEKGDTTFLFLHGPPINPKNTISIFKRFDLPKYKDEILTKIDEYKESRVTMLGKEPSAARIDEKFDVRYGVVSSNWEKLISFCKDYCALTLCGHTHQLNEFRLSDSEAETKEILRNEPLTTMQGETPAAIYYDNYSEMYTSEDEIEKHGPFVVQTPALGLGSYFNPKLSGAYREIIIKNGKLASFKVKIIYKKGK